jgi:hypothetical protein
MTPKVGSGGGGGAATVMWFEDTEPIDTQTESPGC